MRFLTLLIVIPLLANCTHFEGSDQENKSFTEWRHYLGDPGRSHFSTLSQITTENVQSLKVAWEYESADFGQMQMNPIVVDNMLFGVSAALRAFALDARTGKEIWVFGDSLKTWYSTSRGVSYWQSGSDKRIFYTLGSDLWALDARTGLPVTSFGDSGKIDLHSGLPPSAKEKFVISSTPGTIFKNLIIMPLRLSEGVGAAPGNLMAFDTFTGKLVWSFHTLPHQGEAGDDTWGNTNISESELVGAANNWAGMSMDLEEEILFVPTGSAAPDFYGGMRPGKNLYSNCLLALNANTGKLLWYYQFVHHDLWDRDPPAPPNLITVNHLGKSIPAVAQVTKQGYVFVFNRITGAPLFDIEEVPVPTSGLPGEQVWPTQPIPVSPKPFARMAMHLKPDDISPYAPDRDSLKDILRSADRRLFAPPSLTPSLLLPGYDGGAEWGGAGADPDNGILYINSNEMAWFLQMKTADNLGADKTPGERIYLQNCAVCHQSNRAGLPKSGYPDLREIASRLSDTQIQETIKNGKGMMPGFPQLSTKELQSLTLFLSNKLDKQEVSVTDLEGSQTNFIPFQHTGYSKFLDKNGLPAISPPWGTLQALDLNTGEYLWRIPLGETDSLRALGYPTTGTENYGGPIIKENGLLFIAATKDGYIRAFHKDTGALLWEFKLPAAAFATPALYEIEGVEYLVIACGGEKLGTPKGNKLVAFRLD
ncbi:PQQ-binding-like beta-propeller repeat protein [Robiginitalea sp.]|nr:PQQ-binding-like beta-propeller repeat protein [Robiginitalea sp.]